jgi:ATP-dependent helicase/nuclease subunit B
LKQLCRDVEYALAWRNQASLDESVVSSLTTWPMKTSTSRLATFATCPYQYFARYTLGLKKRDLLRLMPVDVGDFYHMILNRLFLELYRRGQDWTSAGNEVLAQYCDRIASQLLQEDRHLAAFVRGSAYNAYIIEEAISNLKAFLPALAAAGASGSFRQKAAELEFGINNPPVVVEMEKNHLIYLNGRIDRVDCADIDGQWTAIVIDYKSGSSTKKMNWTKFFHGLDVQLAVYCLALRRQTIENRPIEAVAGAFYIPLEKSLKTGFKNSQDDSDPTIKARGIFNGQYAQSLEPDCEKSKYYSFAWKEDAPYSDYGRKDALRPGDFAATLHFAEEKIRTLGRQMASGDIRAFPYRLGTQSPCSNCDYRPVCKFDWQLNDYHVLSSSGKLEVLEQIATGGEQ